MYSEGKLTKTLEFGAKKDLPQAKQGDVVVASAQKSLELTPPKGFGKAFLKARWRKGVPVFVISLCTTLWLTDGEIAGWCNRVNMISP